MCVLCGDEKVGSVARGCVQCAGRDVGVCVCAEADQQDQQSINSMLVSCAKKFVEKDGDGDWSGQKTGWERRC